MPLPADVWTVSRGDSKGKARHPRVMRRMTLWIGVALLFTVIGRVQGQNCSQCAEWNIAQKPFKLYGNSFYVGPHGLSSVLITSPKGHVLIDGALEQSAPQIEANIRDLGFRVEDIKLIVNTHVHFDHAGGIAELQRASGARVVASRPSAEVLEHGAVSRDDPQYGEVRNIAKVKHVSTLIDGETLRVGSIALTAHLTPGHTPGGTSWTWSSCEGERCLQMVFADSISAIANNTYRYSDHPDVLAGFERDFRFLETVPCDVLITAHPDASGLWERVGYPMGTDNGKCRELALDGRAGLKERLEKEARHR